MIYLPDSWIEHEKNKNKVREIIDSTFQTDINLSDRLDEAIKQLREIGENTLAEKLKNGEIILPC